MNIQGFSFPKFSCLTAACASIIVAGLLAVPAAAQTNQTNPVRGRELAKRLCVNCHVVVPGQDLRAVQAASGFREIANRPGQSLEKIAGAVIIPHPDMPAVSLTVSELRDLVGYIMSLKGAP
ncbi:MAG: hypothetical protein ACR2O4_12150 [Hyphomicrobiaceae bacterium]